MDAAQETRKLDDLAPSVIRWTRGLGAAGLIAGLLAALLSQELRHHFFEAYLANFAYFLSLALGGLFFVLLQHLTRSGWSVAVRRVAEAVAATMPHLAIMAIPVLLGMHFLYEWTHEEAVAGDAILTGKSPYLNETFFILRIVLYFAVWILLANYYFRRSVAQDTSGDAQLTLRMERYSAPSMILYGFTVTFGAFDLLMSVDPHWFSTIFGVYYFSGAVVAILALLIVAMYILQSRGRLVRTVTVEHYHDLGKLLFGFTVFWAYIAFSQYMLIWYANLPEETGWFLRRQENGWASVSLLLLFGHFIVPFLWLISRHTKRHPAVLTAAAIWLLIMHWVDLYWLVIPNLRPEHPWPHWLDVTTFVGLGAFFIEAVVHRLKRCSLVPVKDPRLPESLSFENL